MGISGWARNQPDGTVLVHAQGSAEDLATFTERLRQGPHFARVDAVDISPTELQEVDSFEVRGW